MLNKKIEIVFGDITKIPVDIIVNAANTSLLGGGGVDGAIHKAGGLELLEECQKVRRKQGRCKTGEAVITGAGSLPANYVVHAVGPYWSGGNNNEKNLLYQLYQNCLKLAVLHQATSISFPNISTGIYKFPKEIAASIALNSICSFLKKDSKISLVKIVCFEVENYQIYTNFIDHI